jgi:hypothetical protein
VRNEIRKNTPRGVSYHYFLWRLLFRRFFGSIKEGISRVISEITLTLQHGFEAIKELLKKILKYLSEIPSKIIKKFKKKQR